MASLRCQLTDTKGLLKAEKQAAAQARKEAEELRIALEEATQELHSVQQMAAARETQLAALQQRAEAAESTQAKAGRAEAQQWQEAAIAERCRRAAAEDAFAQAAHAAAEASAQCQHSTALAAALQQENLELQGAATDMRARLQELQLALANTEMLMNSHATLLSSALSMPEVHGVSSSLLCLKK